MDIKTNFINNVTTKLTDQFDQKSIIIIQNIITNELEKHELNEKSTSVEKANGDSIYNILKKYIATKRIEGLADSTLKRYASENLKMISFVAKPLNEINAFDIRYYLSYRKQSGTVANNTLDGMRRCYSAFFKWLQSEKIITDNPCIPLSQIKCKKTIKKPFSPMELEKIRLACSNIRDRALVEFLYSTGCRVSEVSRLNIFDITGNECLVTGKGDKERIVYISQPAMLYLTKYLKTRSDNYPALFIGKGSERLSKTGIEAIVRRIGEKAGVENVHPHRFRRTLATNLLDRGMNIQDVAAILGHSDLKTTQIYCFISQNNVKGAYVKYAS